MAAQIQPALTILRRRQVEARTGMGRSAIYANIKAGTFPKPVSIGPRSVGWVEAEIFDWIAKRIEASRTPAASV